MKSNVQINFVTLELTRPEILKHKDWKVMQKVKSLVTHNYLAALPNLNISLKTNSK